MPWTLINLAISFLAFGALARLTPCNPGQRAFASPRAGRQRALLVHRRRCSTAALSIYTYARAPACCSTGAAPAATAAILGGYGWAAHLPLVAQAALALVAMDSCSTGCTALFHGRTLWPFHAIHHSAEALDWTTTYRIHPVNFAVYSAGALALVKLVGFSPAAFLIMGPFNLVFGAMVHANLNWTFGPLRYVIASPVYHRWHHVKDPAVHDRNFAPTFPVLDLMFGTYYMPQGRAAVRLWGRGRADQLPGPDGLPVPGHRRPARPAAQGRRGGGLSVRRRRRPRPTPGWRACPRPSGSPRTPPPTARLAAWIAGVLVFLAVAACCWRGWACRPRLARRLEAARPRPWLASAAVAGMMALALAAAKALVDATTAWRLAADRGRRRRRRPDAGLSTQLAAASAQILPTVAAAVLLVPPLALADAAPAAGAGR